MVQDQKEVHSETNVEIDSSTGKIVALGVIGVASAILFGYFLQQFAAMPATITLIAALAASAIFLIIFLLNVFFIKSFWRGNAIIFLAVAGFVLGAYAVFSLLLLGVALFVLLACIAAHRAGRAELSNMLVVKFRRVAKRALPLAILGLAMITSTVYYHSFERITARGEAFFIDRESFNRFIFPAGPIIQKLLPEFDFSDATEDVLRMVARAQVQKSAVANTLSEEQKELLIEKSLEELEGYVADIAGAPLDMTNSLSDTLYQLTAEKFSGSTTEVKAIVQVATALFIFLIIWGLSMPIRWIVSILAYLCYEISIATGFATIALEERGREVVVLK